jgi:bifunctional non-homologous end joining protein LigD
LDGGVAEYAAMKAVLTDRAFSEPGWVFERKLDGVRCGVIRNGGEVRLVSRTGQDMTRTYPELAEELTGGPDLLVDGEVVAFKGGATSFERLQGRLGIHDPEAARRTGIAVYLYLFDILELDGRDVRSLPLRERKQLLREAVRWHGHLRWTPHRVGDGEALLADACRRGWEGLIAKRVDSPYRATRSRDWLKLKCNREQELVIGGWTAPKGSRERLGALLVGYWDGDDLRYAGKVGTGFDHATLEKLGDALERLERPDPPFARGGLPRAARWAEPELVAQIGFTEWTRDGKLRHPRYMGLRDDKPAREVVREVPS